MKIDIIGKIWRKSLFLLLTTLVLLGSSGQMGIPVSAAGPLTVVEYPAPVFPPLIPDQAYVIKDNVNYKLYYAGNDFKSINLAQSPDGITWTPYIGNPIISDAQYHSDVKYYSTGFGGANSGDNPSSGTMNYRMWYQGLSGYSIGGWRYAESPDGINWYNHIAVSQFGPPVFSALTGVNYGIADAVYTQGAANSGTDWTFRIYANVQWEAGDYSGRELVVMAFSSDGYNWTGYDPTNVGYATPVFAGTLVPGEFDCDHIGWFKVIKNSPTDWEAFYSGGQDTTYKALNGIGNATSVDGINWTRQQTLFTTSDGVPWRSQSVWMPSVVKTGSSYQIWFLGSDNPDIDNSDWIQWKLGGANLIPVGGGDPNTNLEISKTSDTEVTAGHDLTYTITVKNNGPSDATGVQVTDTLPGGVTYKSNTPSQGSYTSGTGIWDVGDLSNGASATLNLVVRVNLSALTLNGGVLTNIAQVSGNESDPDTTDNTASQNTGVLSPRAVGGEVQQTDKFRVMIPGLFLALGLIIGGVIILSRRRKAV